MEGVIAKLACNNRSGVEMKQLLIIRGNSGSGKTSLAKEIQKEFGRNTLLISQDVVRREMLWVKDGKGNLAENLLIDLLEYGHQHCELTILEGILNADWYQSLFERACELYGDSIHAYYYDLTFEETLRRHAGREQRHEFGEEAMRRWWKEKDYLEIIQERLILADQSLVKTKEEIIRDLRD